MGFFSKSIWKETKQPEKNFFFLSCRKCTLNRCLPVSLSDLYNVLYLCRIDCCFNNVACYINTNSKEFVQRAVFDVVVVAVFVVTFFLEGVKRGGGFLFFYNTKSNLKKKKLKNVFSLSNLFARVVKKGGMKGPLWIKLCRKWKLNKELFEGYNTIIGVFFFYLD